MHRDILRFMILIQVHVMVVHISEVFNHPSSFGLDKIDGGPFFSLGKYVDTTLYLDVSKGTGHVGNVYYTGNKVEPEVNLSIKILDWFRGVIIKLFIQIM